jgi:hypothetical protein
MKIALCLQGLSSGRNDKGNPVSFNKSLEYLKENILKDNDIDIFLHTCVNDEDKINQIEDVYKPELSIYEKQIIFDKNNVKLHSTKSRWYSHMKSVDLKRNYELKNNFIYDYVLVSRFDNCFLKKFDFSKYKKDFFYSSEWEYPHNVNGFLDYWFFSDSFTMDKFSNLYKKVDKYVLNDEVQLSNHVLSKHHAGILNLKCAYTKQEYKDFCLERCL